MKYHEALELIENSKRDDYIIVGSEVRALGMLMSTYRRNLVEAINILESKQHMMSAQDLAHIANLKATL
jgi:hypothetical protein